MTNEEAVSLIQEGNQDLIIKLWQDNMRLVFKLVNKYRFMSDSEEDVLQNTFIIFMYAVEHYAPDKGMTFASYFYLIFPDQLRRMVNDQSLIRVRPSRLNDRNGISIASLDAPIQSGNDSIPLADTIQSDIDVEEGVVDADQQSYKRVLLEKAISNLNDRCKEPVRMYYFEGKTDRQISEIQKKSPSAISQSRKKGLRKLKSAPELQELRKDYIDTYAYKGKKTSTENTAINLAMRF